MKFFLTFKNISTRMSLYVQKLLPLKLWQNTQSECLNHRDHWCLLYRGSTVHGFQLCNTTYDYAKQLRVFCQHDVLFLMPQAWKIVGNSYNVCRRANHSYHCFEATSLKVRLLTKSFFGSWWRRDKPIVRSKVVCRLWLEIYQVWEVFWSYCVDDFEISKTMMILN